jgi:hypothetical protein
VSVTSTASPRPRFGNIRRAVDYSGRSRATLYIWASRTPELFKKDGKSTIVDFSVLDGILDALPIAQIKMPTPR